MSLINMIKKLINIIKSKKMKKAMKIKKKIP